MHWRSIMYLCCIFFVLAARTGYAQEEEENEPDAPVIMPDTIQANDQELIEIQEKNDDTRSEREIVFGDRDTKKIPRKAALYAAVLPGLGQVYNGSYWKLPIVYGTFITLGWFANFNNDRYLLFRRANIALQNNLPEENPLQGTVISTTGITSAVESSRRSRDYVYILMAGAYALQIMEAIVDAHLLEFDVNEDLSMNFQPSVGQYFASAGGAGSFVPAMGVSLILTIK